MIIHRRRRRRLVSRMLHGSLMLLIRLCLRPLQIPHPVPYLLALPGDNNSVRTALASLRQEGGEGSSAPAKKTKKVKKVSQQQEDVEGGGSPSSAALQAALKTERLAIDADLPDRPMPQYGDEPLGNVAEEPLEGLMRQQQQRSP
jgi:hypothetical protein